MEGDQNFFGPGSGGTLVVGAAFTGAGASGALAGEVAARSAVVTALAGPRGTIAALTLRTWATWTLRTAAALSLWARSAIGPAVATISAIAGAPVEITAG